MHAPLDPECPAVSQYRAATDDDPIMQMSGCADEFAEVFEQRHRSSCERCKAYGCANIEAVD
jgi:hypothetical protein